MNQFFSWPLTQVAWALAGAVGVLLVSLAFMALRARMLWTLGTRNLARRRLRAGLIVWGLMLATTVIGTAFGTGDTISYTLRSLVTGSLGTIDEVVVQNPPRTRGFAALRTVTQPGLAALAAANLAFFTEASTERLMEAGRSAAALAGALPAVITQNTVIHPGSQQLQSFPLLAVPQPEPQAFGSLETVLGEPVNLDALGADQVLLNAAAAEVFDAQVGDALVIQRNDQMWNVTIGAIVRNSGLAGLEPLVIAPLRPYQRVINQAGQINHVIIANQDGIARSAEAARTLRALLADHDAAQQLHDLLARPEVQRGLLDAERNVQARDRDRLRTLRLAAAQPTLTDEFISLVSEPRLRGRLGFLARALPDATDRRNATNLLGRIATLSVLEVKAEALDRANEYGAVITTVFLVLGLFSLAAAVLLIFLIFALLAADRSVELATLRALGMRRRQIMRIFLFEGVVYDVLGAVLGTVVSIATGYAIALALARGLAPFGIRVAPHVEWRSLAITSLLGVLLIFVAMVGAVRRVSAGEIVAATRGVTSPTRPRTRLGMGVLLVGAAAFVWWRWHIPVVSYEDRHPLVAPITLSLVLVGLAYGVAAWVYNRRLAQAERVGRGGAVGVGMGLMAIWLWTLAHLPTPNGDTRRDALTLVVAGCILIPTTVWTVTQGLGPLLKGLDRALAGWGRMRAIVRTAAGYLGQQRWRTGLTVVMFGMVMFMLVLALTLIQVITSAYADREAPVAGFDLRADVQGGQFDNIDAALATATAIKRDAFGALGGIATEDVQVVQFGLPQASWQATPMQIADGGFLAGAQVSMERRAVGYADATAVWAALRSQPGTAVVTVDVLRAGVALTGAPTADTMHSLTIWARPARDGRPIKLTVIGVVSGRSELDSGIYTSRATAAGLGTTLPAPAAYFFAVQPGLRVQNAAEGLRVSLGGQGLQVTALGEALRIANAVRLLLIRVVQGFMGLGLIAGIAALGLLAVQAVIERRQQLGTLRALGFTRRQTRALLLWESAIIAALGIVLGLVLGLIVARSLVGVLASAYPEVRYLVPWGQIALAALVACGGSAFAITIATWEAGRVSPAEALRTV